MDLAVAPSKSAFTKLPENGPENELKNELV